MAIAQITNGIVDGSRDGDVIPAVAPPGRIFRVVADAIALSGHTYDPATDTFAPPPPGPRVLTYNEFIQLFTATERKAFRALVQTNADAEDLYDLLQTSPQIILAAPKTAQFLTQLVTLGVLTAARRTAILNS